MSDKKSIAFVGVGRMGANIARRLKSRGFAVAAVYDSRREVAEKVAAEIGAEAVRNLLMAIDLAKEADRLRGELADNPSEMKQKKASTLLKILEAFMESGN